MKRSGLSLSDSGGIGLSQSGNHFITSSLSSSGPLPKKAKYLTYYGIAEDFCGFSDEPSVHLNAVKMMNTELFCKTSQLSENINILQAKVQSSTKKEESLKEKWKMIQIKGQSLFQEIGNKIQMELPNKDGKALEAAQKSNLVQSAALHVRDLKALTNEQRTFFEKFRNSIFHKTSDDVLNKNLTVRQEENVLFHAHSHLATQIEEIKNQFISLEEESRAFNVIQDEIKQIKERIEMLKKLHHGLKPEQEMDDELIIYDDCEDVNTGNGEAFETSKTKNEISTYQAISKSKEESKNMVENQLSLLQRQLPKQPLLTGRLSEEMIRDSLVFKSVDSRTLHYSIEAEAWGHEGHTIMNDLMELERQRAFDKDLMGKLDQMHGRAKDEKVTHLDQRTKNLKKEKDQLKEKYDQKKKEVEEKDLQFLIAQLAEVESKVEKGKQIIDEKEIEKAKVTRDLEMLETQETCHVSPSKSVNDSYHQIIRKQSNIYELIIEEMKSIKAELLAIQKKKNIAEMEEKEIVLLINRQKSKVSPQYVKKAEILAREKTLISQVKSLQQTYQATISQQPNSPENQILSNKLAQMLSKDIFNNTNETKSVTLNDKRNEVMKSVEELKKKVDDYLMSNEEMKEEINEVHSEFLSVLNENIKQMKELAEYEDNNLKLVAQCTKQHQIHGLLKRKLEILNDKIAKFEQKAQTQDDLLKKYSKKVKISETQVGQAHQELDLIKPLADGNDLVKDSGNQLLIELKRKYEELLTEIENAKGLVDTSILIEKEKAQQLKLKDEIYILNQKIEFTSKHKLEESREGDDEVLTYYKKLINCSACQERLKNFVITRCYHLFCEECIESYSECPTCFRAYSERDIKQIFI